METGDSHGLSMRILARLAAHDPLSLECDGFTRVASYVLVEEGVPHRTMAGYIVTPWGSISPHFWISLNGGWVVDFRLRMWVGQEAPHGVFRPDGVKYTGSPVSLHVSRALFEILGGIGEVNVAKKYPEKCGSRHTPFQPDQEQFTCPLCGEVKQEVFGVEISAPGVTAGCKKLHAHDIVKCSACDQTWSGKFLAELLKKAAAVPVPGKTSDELLAQLWGFVVRNDLDDLMEKLPGGVRLCEAVSCKVRQLEKCDAGTADSEPPAVPDALGDGG